MNLQLNQWQNDKPVSYTYVLDKRILIMPTIYFDTVLSTQFSDGVIRFGLSDYVGPAVDGKRPTGEVTHLATSLSGLLQLQSQINQMVSGLVDKQVLRKQENSSPHTSS